MSELTHDMVANYAAKLQETKENQALQDAIMGNGIHGATLNHEAVAKMNPVFSEEIETGQVLNQKKSGRCWIFAALNTFRHKVSTQINKKDFELSEGYMMFWDKLEKCNYFLENIIKTLDEPLDGRLLSFLLATPQQDGGQWDMLVSLVHKYGVVPKQMMQETYQSSDSKELNAILDAKLRECAVTLRKQHEQGQSVQALEEAKQGILGDLYTILAFTLGEPPTTFDFEYRDDDGKFHREQNLTPQDFFKKYGPDLDDYVSIINAPTEDKPYEKIYTVQFLGNVVHGQPIQYLNVDMDTLKDLAIQQLQDGETVWFGCDVERYSDRKAGILDPYLYDYDSAFGTPLTFTKAERLNYKESQLTHAMVLTGVNIVNDKPNRWKVENSWGEDAGHKGYFIMSDTWMDEYTYEIVVNKKYLSKSLQKTLKQTPIELEPWDPMGSLAMCK